jgi:membrane-bound ClpP family serine protease
MSTLTRYCLLQLPGLLLLATALWWAQHLGYLPAPWAVGLWLTWITKDALMYPLTRQVLEPTTVAGVRAMHGQTGRVLRSLNPEGLVQIGNERWLARSADDSTLPPDCVVTVIGSAGLQLIVTPSVKRTTAD